MRLIAITLLLVSVGLTTTAFAHPEDEFCTPGEGGLDPALCLALSELDRPGSVGDSAPVAVVEVDRSAAQTFVTYVRIGVGHILPGGLDHILFVAAFFLSSRNLKTLLWQIAAFTVAHTVTLGLAGAGVISPPASVVEPVIAFSIAWVALENLFRREPGRARTALVFAFGLVHGMGFAGFFGELGLPVGAFLAALVGFNVGVEIGQLAVIAAALVVTYPWRPFATSGGGDRYGRWVVRPVSLAIAGLALYWTFERVLGS